MLGVGNRAAYRSHRDTIDPEYSEMTTNILVTFYSTYGHVHRMALAVAEGAESVPDTTVRLRRIAELEEARKALSAQDAYVRAQQAQADIPVVTHDDLRWADGIAWGTPTRYGNMSAQMKQFLDTTGGLWLKGELDVVLRIEPPPRQLKFLGLRVGRSVESSRRSRRPHPQPVSIKAPDLGCRGFVAQLSAHFMRGCRRAPLVLYPTPIASGSLCKIAHST